MPVPHLRRMPCVRALLLSYLQSFFDWGDCTLADGASPRACCGAMNCEMRAHKDPLHVRAFIAMGGVPPAVALLSLRWKYAAWGALVLVSTICRCWMCVVGAWLKCDRDVILSDVVF